MVKAYLSLGSNIGDRRHWLRFGVGRFANVVAVSAVFETTPVGGPPQGMYFNAVVCIETNLRPNGLLQLCHEIEAEAGRVRGVANGPRTLDIDILLYGDDKVDEPGLKIPHERMCQRNFVLVPLFQIFPDFDGCEPPEGFDSEVRLVGPL